ncbi:HET-domain-containing protein [Lentithecium fluviatile CBS 122367]|uniref:HET-domain-containing protein n=1 Tax=Lentithecium fluviatile CBS 122367 TaxID=1168545 RepID=A0A6G1IUF7_9PLEO|nr:HET-domain-containing protein [Lentithecium fluviatile CBS 122367]
MRLINTSTGKLEEFIGKNIPKYAILSHTWGEEEVSFRDYVNGGQEHKKGFKKIAMTCRLAAKDGLEYAWVDTCAIDKSSSAELTEAINSMYRWYERAEVCYAFLSDLSAGAELDDALGKCRWFTRGWTLQELIAPRVLHFFDQKWNNRGSKFNLAKHLADITGIRVLVLQGANLSNFISVAEKMSWAAKRETTRVEDLAYALLGIFDVNMPLLYGEEEKAFRRLQDEIVRSTPDLSIFAWRLPQTGKESEYIRSRTLCGVFAESPAAFSGCRNLSSHSNFSPVEFSISNVGIKLKGHIIHSPGSHYVLPIHWGYWTSKNVLGVELRKIGPDQFLRQNPWEVLEYPLHQVVSPNSSTERHLLTKLLPTAHSPRFTMADTFVPHLRRHALQIRSPPAIALHTAWPLDCFDDQDQIFFISDYARGDFSSIRLRISSPLTIHTFLSPSPVKVEFDCIFYAVGWSAGRPQCTLFDYQSNARLVNELQFALANWAHDGRYVLEQLAFHKVPKLTRVVHRIPGTERAAVVSFKPYLEYDTIGSVICKHPYWIIDFSFELCDGKDIPEVEQEVWDLDSNHSTKEG